MNYSWVLRTKKFDVGLIQNDMLSLLIWSFMFIFINFVYDK